MTQPPLSLPMTDSMEEEEKELETQLPLSTEENKNVTKENNDTNFTEEGGNELETQPTLTSPRNHIHKEKETAEVNTPGNDQTASDLETQPPLSTISSRTVPEEEDKNELETQPPLTPPKIPTLKEKTQLNDA
eukprot:7579060-Ditylum_brightwellii.AAC.1